MGKSLGKKYKRGWIGTRESGRLPLDMRVSESVLTGNWEQFKNASARAPALFTNSGIRVELIPIDLTNCVKFLYVLVSYGFLIL